MGAALRAFATGPLQGPRARARARLPLGPVLGRAAGVVAAVALLALALVCLGWVTGHRALVDRSDSMRPALHAGDLVINRRVPAQELVAGEIVTFEDPTLGRNITHRLAERRARGGRVAFVTKGDANSNVERWSAAPKEGVGRLVTSIPRVGFVVAFVTSPIVRLVLTAICAAGLCALALRWIWRVQ